MKKKCKIFFECNSGTKMNCFPCLLRILRISFPGTMRNTRKQSFGIWGEIASSCTSPLACFAFLYSEAWWRAFDFLNAIVAKCAEREVYCYPSSAVHQHNRKRVVNYHSVKPSRLLVFASFFIKSIKELEKRQGSLFDAVLITACMEISLGCYSSNCVVKFMTIGYSNLHRHKFNTS